MMASSPSKCPKKPVPAEEIIFTCIAPKSSSGTLKTNKNLNN